MRYDYLQRTSRDRQDKEHKLIQQPKNTNNGEPIDLRRNPEPKVQQKICLGGALVYCEMGLQQELRCRTNENELQNPVAGNEGQRRRQCSSTRESSTLLEGRRRRHEATVQETGRLLVEVSIDVPRGRFFVSFHRPFRRPNSSLFVLTTSHIDGGGWGPKDYKRHFTLGPDY
ncbi:unnamed protein product [Sphagnum jensenii]|uniref:Uncharacterized protein n=1 Tax=Sphagnum jensenii TaxID=128206 RepID=A0ABP1BGZ3_9BRYO